MLTPDITTRAILCLTGSNDNGPAITINGHYICDCWMGGYCTINMAEASMS